MVITLKTLRQNKSAFPECDSVGRRLDWLFFVSLRLCASLSEALCNIFFTTLRKASQSQKGRLYGQSGAGFGDEELGAAHVELVTGFYRGRFFEFVAVQATDVRSRQRLDADFAFFH